MNDCGMDENTKLVEGGITNGYTYVYVPLYTIHLYRSSQSYGCLSALLPLFQHLIYPVAGYYVPIVFLV
jgi:hypothetical protein